MTFGGFAGFGDATFDGDAGFAGGAFGGMAVFGQAAFKRDAGFAGAVFRGPAWLGGASFGVDVWFDRAVFHRYAGFERTVFSVDAWFGEVTFHGLASFREANFPKARQIGPVLAHRGLVLDAVSFGSSVAIEASTCGLCCRGARFARGVQFRVRWALLALDDTDFTAPRPQQEGCHEDHAGPRYRTQFAPRAARAWQPSGMPPAAFLKASRPTLETALPAA